MDAAVKQKVMIGIVVVCLLVAIGITISSRTGGSARGSLQMLCTNPDCGKDYEMSKNDFRQKVREMATGPDARLGPMGQMPPLTCEYCGKESVHKAIKCEQCGEIYIPDRSVRTSYPDKCPECGYSAIKEQDESSRN